MAITINTVTINNRLTIVNDAAVNADNPNNGPREYSGDTEADVIIDGAGYLNITAHDVIPSDVHALQYNAASNTGHIELVGNADNTAIADASGLPAWANTMVTRWNGEKTYWTTYQTEYDNALANLDASSETYDADVAAAQTAAVSSATTAKNNVLSA
jgi:hypothetical protein|tara:strand:- start:114 stop:587 length:474 start_codon:yes stop_codon:yes gene_type:complete